MRTAVFTVLNVRFQLKTVKSLAYGVLCPSY